MITRRSFARVLCGVTLALGSPGCGYSLAGHGTFLPASITTIGIPTFDNHSTVFNLETLLTQKVRAEFIGRGKYRILTETTDADAVLTGDVTAMSVTPTSFTAQQLASRYAVTMVVNIQLRNLRDNKVLWENPGLVFRQEYEASLNTNAAVVDPNSFLSQEANALDRVGTDFARAIVSSILEAF